MYKVSVTLNYDIPQEDIDTLIDMAGYGINYWARTAEVDEHTYTVQWDDDLEQPRKAVVSHQSLADALVWVATNHFGYVGDYARDYFKEEDAGNIDGDLADVVVQIAIFGEVIYG